MYAKGRVDRGHLEDEHLQHAMSLLKEQSLAMETDPGEGRGSVIIYKLD